MIIFPGNNRESNEEWLKNFSTFFEKDFKVFQFKYNHWKNASLANLNFDKEIEKISNLVQFSDIVVGKSAGAILILLAVYKNKINPKKAILLGVPIKDLMKDEMGQKVFLNFDLPTLLIQQKNDKYSTFEEIRKIISENKKDNFTLIEIEGGNHKYDDYALLSNAIRQFISCRLS